MVRYDRDFAARMAAKYVHDFAGAHEMSPQDVQDRPWWFLVASRAAYLLAPIL